MKTIALPVPTPPATPEGRFTTRTIIPVTHAPELRFSPVLKRLLEAPEPVHPDEGDVAMGNVELSVAKFHVD